jgi:formamidopyrimidine-DNA glycosylase
MFPSASGGPRQLRQIKEAFMPEIPELTVFAENLAKAVVGEKIVKAAYHRKKRLNVSPEELSTALVSSKISDVKRVGKEICFTLSNGASVVIHLMLSGGFQLTTDDKIDDVKYPVLTLCFGDRSALAVTDPKGWVTVELNPRRKAEVPDAMSITADYLKSKFQKRQRMAIKTFLVDQDLIGGIGNAYADEILWKARISPKSAVGKLPPDAIKSLVESIPEVLKEGIDYIRKHHPEIVSGEVRDSLKVHGASRKLSPTGSKIIKEQILSKTTYYTEEQKLYN